MIKNNVFVSILCVLCQSAPFKLINKQVSLFLIQVLLLLFYFKENAVICDEISYTQEKLPVIY